MALTLITPPPGIGGTRRPLIVQFTTDQTIVSAGSPNTVILQLDSGAAVGDTWLFLFAGHTVVFTAAAAPDGSGHEFTSGSTDAATLTTDLQKNYLLDLHYSISVSTANRILFTAKTAGSDYNLLNTGSTYNGFSQFSFNDGTDPVTLPNFQSWLDLYTELVRDGGDYGTAPVARLSATIGSGLTFNFDLGAIMDAYVEDDQPAPFTGSILLSLLPLRRFRFRYCEAFGSPIAPQAVTETGVFTAFRGRRELESPGLDGNHFEDTILSGRPASKTIPKGQVEYLYLLTVPTTFNMTVTAYKADGSSQGIAPPALPSYSGWAVMKIPMGHDQLGIGNLIAGAVRYTVRLDYGGSKVRTYTFYQRDLCPPHSTHLLFRNALGGYDTLPIAGRKTKTGSFAHDSSDRPVPANYTAGHRETHTLNHRSSDAFDMHTGWVFSKTEVAYYARQFFMSENILLPDGEAWMPLHLLTKEVIYTKDGTNLYGFGFKAKRAINHQDHHTSFLI